ncbi:MAG: hypothetical protein QOC78_1569 [Solirubrobacteraceae bacterium]|nr:hypothetical protein [Solirubrobacteraceae bacterium]
MRQVGPPRSVSQAEVRTPSPPRIRLAAIRIGLAALVAAIALGLTPVGAVAAPTASFTVSPAAPKAGQTVTFTGSATADPLTTIVSFTWDLAGTPGNGATVSQAFPAGTHTITLTVLDSAGATGTASTTVTVAANVAPVASFTVTPAAPNVGQAVTLRSTSNDPDGTIAGQSWDLNGDGVFGDSLAATARQTFTTAGPHVVSLRVTDNNGATTVATTTVTVNAPPVASFTVVPAVPVPGSGVTFTSTAVDPDGTVASQAWDLDGNGIFVDAFTPIATFTYLTSGPHTVGLRVTDNGGAVTTSTQTVIVDQPPVASFTFTPAAPVAGQAVSFASTSTDADGTIVALAWDMTGNGLFTDAAGPTATKVFAHSGEQIVRLRATDDRGVSTIIAGTVSVGGPPIASFSFSPTAPAAGRTVTFTSSSRDIDGAVVNQAWDLNGDGQFSDASGPTAQYAFPAAGNYTVALRVTDNSGLTSTAFQTVAVGAASGQAASTARSQTPGHPLLALFPFPIVRIAGRLTPNGARIVLLEVHAPRGVRVVVRCRGGGCPRRDIVATVKGKKPLHFSRMRRALRAGAVVQVFVRGTGRIGKYTRFLIRRGRAPARRDMCLVPGARAPTSCRAT